MLKLGAEQDEHLVIGRGTETDVAGIAIAVALFAVGALVKLALEGPVPRAITVICFFAFFVVGMLTVASPDFLSSEPETHDDASSE